MPYAFVTNFRINGKHVKLGMFLSKFNGMILIIM